MGREMIISGNEASKEFQPHSAPSSGCQAAGFHCDCGLCVFKATEELGKWAWKLGELKHHRGCVLTEIQLFFFIKTPRFAATLWLISRDKKILNLPHIPSGLIVLMEEKSFRGSYSAILAAILSL